MFDNQYHDNTIAYDWPDVSEAYPHKAVISAEALRRLMDIMVPQPPEGYAICCYCKELTPSSSFLCRWCGSIYCEF